MEQKNSLYKTLVVKAVKEEVKDFKTFTFEDSGIEYQPGQYLTLVHTFEGKEVRRSYSITSVPGAGELLSIGVKRIENGIFSRYLTDHVQPGDTILTIGASGRFTFPENIGEYEQVFFLAAGSGITPIFSLIKSALHSFPHLHVVLIYSNRSAEQTAFRGELEQLAAQYPERLKIEFLYSITKNLVKAHLYRELLHGFVSTYNKALPGKSLFYTCGPEAYMRMCTFALKEVDVPDENIKKENFNTTKPPVRVELADKNDYTAHIHFAGKQYDFRVNYPDTILGAAKKQGISLPYSCEAGRCASCVMRCTEGKVWMSYNEVLTEKDLKQGLVLTCVGHPVNGDVTLEG